ncbi:Mesencephalic astrocyte-derived neurotrophic factor [Portunus trituberculatus]|uniref:Mesencephalic astrocyte-derived neurotrophic factor n=1 Tax=Portunus trituberculatus TaxID=210409 RepID=A0A5B7G005_PORTR|nr:Mesencephalic astrocyte-derived neurotrophic factor [Portunus trituberculatus]
MTVETVEWGNCRMNLMNVAAVLVLATIYTTTALKLEDCEVCITFMTKFSEQLTSDEKKDTQLIERKFKETCAEAKESRVQVVLLACKEDTVSPAFLIESADLKIVETVDGVKMVASNAISFLASCL